MLVEVVPVSEVCQNVHQLLQHSPSATGIYSHLQGLVRIYASCLQGVPHLYPSLCEVHALIRCLHVQYIQLVLRTRGLVKGTTHSLDVLRFKGHNLVSLT